MQVLFTSSPKLKIADLLREKLTGIFDLTSLRAGCRSHLGIRSQVDDDAAFLFFHQLRCSLAYEVHSFEIDVHNIILKGLPVREWIVFVRSKHAGIVGHNTQSSQACSNFGQPIIYLGDVPEVPGESAGAASPGFDFSGRFFL